MSEFKVGMRVRIIGDVLDCTEHLDGDIGTILEVDKVDCYVEMANSKLRRWIWNRNMTEVTEHES